MRNEEEMLAACLATCRAAGLKATHQRTEIFRELARTTAHPDAETLYRGVKKRIPAISFDTVYRTLRTLAEHGVIVRVGTPLDRARYDANRGRHHHFVCRRCGRIRDVVEPAFDGLAVPDTARAHGIPEEVQVEVRGICHACREKERKPS